ncbi:MAG TPA: pyruvate kinase [Blastocatellia bacterium]|nr:pyruvate kinase [Blastocatellia bacterium]
MNIRKAKIVATIGPASESEEQLRELVLAGVDVTRINASHGEPDHHAEVISRIRRVSGEVGKPVAVMLDLSGPKIRTGRLRNGDSVFLHDGAEVQITPEDIIGDANRFSANYELLPSEVHSGERILIGDGEIELEVLGAAPSNVRARVVHGGLLGEHKGINLPGTRISIPSITDKDLRDLSMGTTCGIDLVAQSFVQNASDCRKARDLIGKMCPGRRLIAKIEKPQAIDDLDNILDVADGVMVARGDLAVETSPEQVPLLQKRIISRALVAQKTVITATQMLQSMVEAPLPTRAEASDVANAVLDGSDALMLSAETAVGRFPIDAVAMMDRIIRSTEQATGSSGVLWDEVGAYSPPVILSNATALLRESRLGRKSGSIGRALAEAAVFAADEVGCRLIVVFTQTGHMAHRVAALRPRQRVIAFTPIVETCRQLAVSWGVEPILLEEWTPASDQVLASGDRALLGHQLANPGDPVVLIAGVIRDLALSTSMKLHRVGDFVSRLASNT